MASQKILGLFAGEKTGGQEVFEEVPVEDLGRGRFRVTSSPGFVEGIASGDIIRLSLEIRGRFEVIERGGNVCIQVYGDSVIDQIQLGFGHLIEQLGGWLDDKGSQVMVYTVPISAGFPAIEKVMAGIVNAFPGVVWSYGNVYDAKDGETPLNWWR